MRPVENIKRFVKNRKPQVIASDDLNKHVLDDSFAAMEDTMRMKSVVPQPNIWRIIMKSIKIRKVKVAIAVIVLMILLGLIPFKGTTAFGKIANEVTTTLARLKAMVLGKELPEAEHVERQIDKSVKILTKSRAYSSPEIFSLEDFLNERNISFVSGDSGTAKYAVIPSDKVAALQEFLQSSDSYNIVAAPTVLTYSGDGAMLAIVNLAGVAITALQDENKQLNLDFAFHNGQDGCEVNGIKLENGEALLISGIKSSKDETSDDLMTILVLPEVIQE